MKYYAQQVVNALSLGGLYALLALGLGIVFNILGLINFAYGELVAIGGYVLFVLLGAGVPLAVALPACVLVALLAGLLMERVAFRPVRGASGVTLLLTSFAVSSILQNSFLIAVSPRAQGVPTPDWASGVVQIAGIGVPVVRLVTMVVTVGCLLGLLVFLRGSDIGIAMRAAAEDFTAVRLMGIKANRVVAWAFAISGTLAGIISVLVVAQTGVVYPTMGVPLLFKAFIAAVMGGLGSLAGAVAGGFLLAFIEVGLQATLPEGALAFRDAFVFAVVVLVLLVKPEGLLAGKREQA